MRVGARLYWRRAHRVSRGDPVAVRAELCDCGRILVFDVAIGLERVLQRADYDALPIRIDEPLGIRMPTEHRSTACVGAAGSYSTSQRSSGCLGNEQRETEFSKRAPLVVPGAAGKVSRSFGGMLDLANAGRCEIFLSRSFLGPVRGGQGGGQRSSWVLGCGTTLVGRPSWPPPPNRSLLSHWASPPVFCHPPSSQLSSSNDDDGAKSAAPPCRRPPASRPPGPAPLLPPQPPSPLQRLPPVGPPRR